MLGIPFKCKLRDGTPDLKLQRDVQGREGGEITSTILVGE